MTQVNTNRADLSSYLLDTTLAPSSRYRTLSAIKSVIKSLLSFADVIYSEPKNLRVARSSVTS